MQNRMEKIFIILLSLVLFLALIPCVAQQPAGASAAPSMAAGENLAIEDRIAKNTPVVDVRIYGAKCDGATDDTAALQAAIAPGVLSGHKLIFPSGATCLVSAPLIFAGTLTRWDIDGMSMGTTIESRAVGLPIFEFATTSSRLTTIAWGWHIHNLAFKYTNAQTFGSNAYAISFGDGGATQSEYFNGEIDHILFWNGYRGISNWSSGGNFWGLNIHDIVGGAGLLGATIAYTSPATSGILRMKLLNIYSSQKAAEPVMNFNVPCYGCTAENIESNNGTNAIYTFGGWYGALMNLHIESNTCTVPGTFIINLPNSNVSLDGATDNANFVIKPGAGKNCYFIGANPPDGLVNVRGVIINATVSSGNLYAFEIGWAPAAGKSRWRIHDVTANVPIFKTTSALLTSAVVDEYEGSTDGATITREVFLNPPAYASASANHNSEPLSAIGAFWNGSGTAIDKWQCRNVMGAGSNPTSTFTCQHQSGGTSGEARVSFPNGIEAGTYRSNSNCAVNSASPAACGSASAGAFVVPAATTSYTVLTSAVTANSVILLTPRTYTANLPSSPTCVVPSVTSGYVVSAILAGTSFTVTLPSTAGKTCWNYTIMN